MSLRRLFDAVRDGSLHERIDALFDKVEQIATVTELPEDVREALATAVRIHEAITELRSEVAALRAQLEALKPEEQPPH